MSSKLDLDKINGYLSKLTPRRDTILRQMEKYAGRVGFPIIGPEVGRFLYQMAAVVKARKVLELGSGFGYSAYWFARAMKSGGQVDMTDLSEENRKKALNYFKKSGLKTRINYYVGDALDIASRIKGKYEIILNDIDKEDYPAAIDLAADRLSKGGLFITDNILWSGRVMDKRVKDRATVAIRKFTEKLYRDKRFYTTLIPLRDGLTLAVRL